MVTSYQEAVEKTIIASEQLNQVINGSATTEVVVESGTVIPSLKKAIVDSFYFKSPLNWQQGQAETTFNQLRKFTDGTLWYAPNATNTNPVGMGASPLNDLNWRIYALDASSYTEPQIRQLFQRSFAEIGMTLVAGSFEKGATLNSSSDVLLQESTGYVYSWKGTFPKNVPAGSTPLSAGGISNTAWVYEGGNTLRTQLGNIDGVNLIGGATYSQIRAYSGNATRIYCVGRAGVFDKSEGLFILDSLDVITADNDGTVLVDSLGRRWKRQFSGSINLRWFGADPTGVSDASPAMQLATIAQGSESLLIDGVYRVTTPVEITKELVFKDSGNIKIQAGVIFRANKRPVATPSAWIFEGKPVTNTIWEDAYLDWFGPDTAGFGVAAQNAFSVTNKLLLNSRSYVQGPSPLVIPQGRNLSIKGAGFRLSKITTPSGSVCISYGRTSAQPASSLEIKDIEFLETTSAKSSISVLWAGYSAGIAGSESVINDDNWLRVEGCVFTGVGRGTSTKFAGQCHFNNNMSLYSSCMHYKERGSSFHYHSGEMCLSGAFVNGAYIYGEDTVNDAYSNGLFIDSCNSVTAAGIDIRLRNWQAVFIDKGGFDLGTAGQCALWFGLCQDVQIDSCWVASSPSAALANRYGVYFDNCRNSNVSKCTVVNNKRGVSSLNSTSIGVSDNTFESNLEYDVADAGSAIGWAIHGNRCRTGVSSGMPIWLGGAGSGSHSVVGNIMKQASYTIPLGVNSQSVANVFGAGLS